MPGEAKATKMEPKGPKIASKWSPEATKPGDTKQEIIGAINLKIGEHSVLLMIEKQKSASILSLWGKNPMIGVRFLEMPSARHLGGPAPGYFGISIRGSVFLQLALGIWDPLPCGEARWREGRRQLDNIL